MAKENIDGLGHQRLVPDQLYAEKISHQIFERNYSEALTPNIALADAEFADDLVHGSVVRFITRDLEDTTLFQETQSNEEPETDTIELCSKEIKLVAHRRFKIKVPYHELRRMEHEGLADIYLGTVEGTLDQSFKVMWDESHLAHMLVQADPMNMGNYAGKAGVNVGSPDNPIVIPQGMAAGADKLEEIITNLQLLLVEREAMNFSGDTALVLPALAASRAMPILRDLNQCCSENNIRITGQLGKTLYGFDTFQTNRRVLSTIYNGKKIYYIIVADKRASGFTSDIYNFKWWEDKFDTYLVGEEVHGSYVVQSGHIAVACVTFA